MEERGQFALRGGLLDIFPATEERAVRVDMFDVEIDGRSYRESELEDPGEEIVLSQTAEGIELGMSICYDLRFPELYRILAVRGARVLVVGKHASKLAFLAKRGIATAMLDGWSKKKADLVVEATGTASGFEAAVAATRPRGDLVVAGRVQQLAVLGHEQEQ